MNILALDTTQNACSVAVVNASNGARDILARAFEWRPRGHAEVLAIMIKEIMAQANMPFGALDKIAVTTGPGSFTGLRVGIAAAKGIALAADIPLIGITSFEAVGANVTQEPNEALPICVVFDARRDEIYMQLFSAGLEPISEPSVCSPAAAAQTLLDNKIIIIGSGADILLETIRSDTNSGKADQLISTSALKAPDAAIFAFLAENRSPEEKPITPLYLRPPDAKPQKPPLARQE